MTSCPNHDDDQICPDCTYLATHPDNQPGPWLSKLVELTEADVFQDEDGVDGYLELALLKIGYDSVLSIGYVPFDGVSQLPGVTEHYRITRLADGPPPYRCPPQTPYIP